VDKAKESAEETRNKKIADDTKFVEGLMAAIGLDPPPRFSSVVRLGRKVEDKIRPMRFRLENLEDKTAVMENLYNLKDAEAPYSDVSVKHDLTLEQRDDLKELLQQAKAENEKPEIASKSFLYIVRSAPGPYWEPRMERVRKRRNTPRA
jgi:hypothetical protein